MRRNCADREPQRRRSARVNTRGPDSLQHALAVEDCRTGVAGRPPNILLARGASGGWSLDQPKAFRDNVFGDGDETIHIVGRMTYTDDTDFAGLFGRTVRNRPTPAAEGIDATLLAQPPAFGRAEPGPQGPLRTRSSNAWSNCFFLTKSGTLTTSERYSRLTGLFGDGPSEIEVHRPPFVPSRFGTRPAAGPAAAGGIPFSRELAHALLQVLPIAAARLCERRAEIAPKFCPRCPAQAAR